MLICISQSQVPWRKVQFALMSIQVKFGFLSLNFIAKCITEFYLRIKKPCIDQGSLKGAISSKEIKQVLDWAKKLKGITLQLFPTCPVDGLTF